MNEQNTPNSVWISREEYERLRQAEARSLSQMYPAPASHIPPTIGSAESRAAAVVPSKMEPASKSSMTTIMSFLLIPLALGAYTFPPLGLVFIILAIVTIVRAKQTNNSVASRLAVGVMTVVGIVVMAPFLLIMAFLIMFQLNCAIDASACRSA